MIDRVKKEVRDLIEFLNDFNTTSGRIVATIGLAYLTGIRVLFLDKWLGPMSVEVLGAWSLFLATLGGMDVYQFNVKRKSFIPAGTSNGGSAPVDIAANRVVGQEEGIEFTR